MNSKIQYELVSPHFLACGILPVSLVTIKFVICILLYLFDTGLKLSLSVSLVAWLAV